MTRSRFVGLALFSLMLALGARPVSAAPLATYQFGPGWASFGLALPQGAARYGVSVGSLRTQTDIKTTWPDGSIRFAVVTARISQAGAYPLTERLKPYRRRHPFREKTPAASVDFNIAGQTWTATLPNRLRDSWLDGGLVSEGRVQVAPAIGGTLHPFLRVVFDVRAYRGGGYRLDVAVENVLDVSEADQVDYDVSVRLGRGTVFSRLGVHHPYLTRWRGVFSTGLKEAEIVPDFTPFIAARAIPAYSPAIDDVTRSTADGQFDILRIGDLHDPMSDHGGRPELAPYPDWTAQYLIHRRSDQRAYMLKHGDLAGTYSIHIENAESGQPISIDDRPNFWLDPRADDPPKAANGMLALGYSADVAHQPSLAYVPYLVTGDRYYADELRFWANFCLIATFQDSFYNARGGSLGSLLSNEVRGIGWAIRTLGDAAAYLPDSDPFRAYFADKLRNNLDLLDSYATSFSSGPLETLFAGRRPEDEEKPPFVWIAPWEHAYVAWAIDHVGQHGFTGGIALRDRVARFQVLLFNGDEVGYPRQYGAPYVLAVGRNDVTEFTFFETVSEVFETTYGLADGEHGPPVSFVGSYGPEARLMLMIAERAGMAGAEAAYSYLMDYTDAEGASVVSDLNHRSGWNILR